MAGIMGGAGGQQQISNPQAAAAWTGPVGAAGAQGNQVTGLLTGPNFGVTPGNALIKNAAALQRVTAQANIGLGARPGVPGVAQQGGAFGAQNPVAMPAAGQFGMTVADGGAATASASPALSQALGAPLDGASASLLGGAQAGLAGGAFGASAGMMDGSSLAAGGLSASNFAGGAAGGQLQQATATGINPITRTNAN